MDLIADIISGTSSFALVFIVGVILVLAILFIAAKRNPEPK